jgi:hypothetical protein
MGHPERMVHPEMDRDGDRGAAGTQDSLTRRNAAVAGRTIPVKWRIMDA